MREYEDQINVQDNDTKKERKKNERKIVSKRDLC